MSVVPAPFAIGLAPLDPDDWIVVDDDLERFLAEKDRLLGTLPDKVIVAEAGTEDAQREVLAMLVAHLPARFPDVHAVDRAAGTPAMRIGRERRVRLDDPDSLPLVTAGRLVQEDLVLMRRGPDGWRLAAACVCFPSSWTLAEKFSRPMAEIHAPVPQFGPGTRTATLIDRIFDNLKPELPVWRSNWSVHVTDELYHPHSGARRPGGYGGPARPFAELEREAAASFLRRERQTLRRLPSSGDILFTIRISVDPLADLAADESHREIAAGLIGRIVAMDEEQLAYKGLVHRRDALLAVLHRLAG